MTKEIDKLLAGADAPANSNTKSPEVVASIIGAVVAIGSLFANAGLSRAAEVRNEHAVAQAREQEIEQWRRQNAYNSPTSQIARLKAAGINPALIYGNGIENTSSDSPTLTSPFAAQRIKDIDPLTASQIQLNAAQAESISHQTKREDEKQPKTLEQLSADIQQCYAKTDEILQSIKNMKFDEQLKSMDYLQKSVDYQFTSTTFNDAVQSVKTGLEAAKLDVDMKSFDLSRALQYLSYEVVGWDLSNKRQRALLNIDLQTYRQTEQLFESVKIKAHWEGQKSYMDWRLKGKEEGLMNADRTLKELSFWIDARENPIAYGNYRKAHGEYTHMPSLDSPFTEFIFGFSDFWNHGLNLPIRLGFGK